jgi:hypothetical protein
MEKQNRRFDSFFPLFLKLARREVGENDNDRLSCKQQLTGDDRHTFWVCFVFLSRKEKDGGGVVV